MWPAWLKIMCCVIQETGDSNFCQTTSQEQSLSLPLPIWCVAIGKWHFLFENYIFFTFVTIQFLSNFVLRDLRSFAWTLHDMKTLYSLLILSYRTTMPRVVSLHKGSEMRCFDIFLLLVWTRHATNSRSASDLGRHYVPVIPLSLKCMTTTFNNNSLFHLTSR